MLNSQAHAVGSLRETNSRINSIEKSHIKASSKTHGLALPKLGLAATEHLGDSLETSSKFFAKSCWAKWRYLGEP